MTAAAGRVSFAEVPLENAERPAITCYVMQKQEQHVVLAVQAVEPCTEGQFFRDINRGRSKLGAECRELLFRDVGGRDSQLVGFRGEDVLVGCFILRVP